eukprot:TRINITY_DN2280_c0_g1_i1.p1 TRINITY_DN2280_c0_g1~~TRINITY_DN2280_c0_g1_i1.p1  ORF type:complete len:552 (+),score=74.51 TRINITY_DN2280_c0_g1_i1:218-1873(+)
MNDEADASDLEENGTLEGEEVSDLRLSQEDQSYVEPTVQTDGKSEFLSRRVLVPLICAMLVALMCGTTSAFFPIASGIQSYFNNKHHATVISNEDLQTFLSFGLIGLYFSIIAGYFNDRYGSHVLLMFAIPLIAPCYIAMSFITTSDQLWIMWILYTIVGFASGAGFLATLSIGLKAVVSNPGTGLALTGSFMSLSLMFTNLLTQLSRRVTNCDKGDEDNDGPCWPINVRTLAIVSCVVQLPAVVVLFITERRKQKQETDTKYTSVATSTPPPSPKLTIRARSRLGLDSPPSPIGIRLATFASSSTSGSSSFSSLASLEVLSTDEPTKVTALSSLKILKNVFFLILMFSMFTGLSSGLIVITQGKLWSPSFTNDAKAAFWQNDIFNGFSIANCISNLLSGWVCDKLLLKYRFQRHKFAAIIMMFTAAIYLFITIIYSTTAASIHEKEPGKGLQVVFAILLASTGACFGSFLTIFPTIVGDYYGPENFGIYYGYLQIGSCIATFVTPIGAQAFYDSVKWNSYACPLLTMTICCILSSVLLLVKKPTAAEVVW